jgi:hypothetical protein
MSEAEFLPFRDDVSVATFDGLSVENGLTALVVSGDLTIPRNETSLPVLQALIALLQSVKAVIVAGPSDDMQVAAGVVDQVDNPF